MQRADTFVEQLIDRARHGDEAAFAALYQRYSPIVQRTAALVLGDAARAEDVTQEVFVRLHRHLHRYAPARGPFEPWLHRITVNACLRARHRWPPWLSLDWARETGHEPAAADAPSIDALLQREDEHRIWQAVQRLPVKLRITVVLRYYRDLSYAEIAMALGCPIGTVRSRLSAAHARLRADLQE